MTDKQMRSLCKWMTVIAREYGLASWDIRIHEATPGDAADGQAAIASVSVIWGRRLAHVTVSPEFATVSPEEQRHVVLHEFTHIHTWSVSEVVRATFAEQVGSLAWASFRTAFSHVEEHATDALTTAIERFYPLWEG